MATIPILALIPSGYKGGSPGTLYSVLPTDGVGDFDFTRSGNATRVNSEGLIELVTTNVPRLNYPLIDGVVSGCPSLLLEPSSINLVPYSEAFDEPDWVKSSSIVTSNQVISPDGTLNADLLETSVAGGGVADTISGSGNYSFSVFAKYKDIQFIRLRSTNSYAWFDVKNGSVGTTISALDAKIEYYGNGWYRCTLVGNNTNTIFQITCTEQNSLNVGFGGVYLWGAQFEAGSYSTSYIPNYGTALGVTRSAETCNNAGDASTFNDSEGVLFAEISKNKGNQYSLVSLYKSSASDTYIYVGYLNNTTQIRCNITIGGTIILDKIITIADTSVNAKMCVKYKSGNHSLFVNGLKLESSTDTTTFSDGDLDEIEFGLINNSIFDFYGNTKQIQYFNTALNDSDLETLTSWDSFSDMATSQLYTIE